MLGALAPRQLGALAFASKAAAATYQANVLAIANLVSYWPLNETAGTTATDVKNAYNGTYNSCTLNDLAGPGASMGSAPKFNSTTSYIQLPSSSLNGAWNTELGTISIWCYLNELWSLNRESYMVNIGANLTNRYRIEKQGTNTPALSYFRGASSGGTTTNTITTAAWHHLAISWNKSSNAFKGYIDGTQDGSTQALNGTWAGSLADNATLIGSYDGYLWNGWLMGCAFFARDVSSTEVTTLATAV
jgi:hypothetical protein